MMTIEKDIYNVYMVLLDGQDVWWQGTAIDGGDALEQAWQYAIDDYKCEPRSWDICGEEIPN
jgi:hypothetical protein